MGPVSMNWYRDRGLTQKQTKTATENSMFTTMGEQFTSESITTHYSCGRIDVHNVPDEPYGDEINVPPMLSTDWAMFSNWLDTVKTMSTWTLADLIVAYQQHNLPITWDTHEH
jgi:hypothetical protein